MDVLNNLMDIAKRFMQSRKNRQNVPKYLVFNKIASL